mgnify:CR=1 FL=1
MKHPESLTTEQIKSDLDSMRSVFELGQKPRTLVAHYRILEEELERREEADG